MAPARTGNNSSFFTIHIGFIIHVVSTQGPARQPPEALSASMTQLSQTASLNVAAAIACLP